MSQIVCKECSSPASVENGKLIRTCSCNAPVVANMAVVLRGAGGIK